MLIKMVILPMPKIRSNKHNMMAIKTQKWKCPFDKIALQKFQRRLTNSLQHHSFKVEQIDQITEIGYQSTQLLQDIEENLPNLRNRREKNKRSINTARKATDNQQGKIGIRLNKD